MALSSHDTEKTEGGYPGPWDNQHHLTKEKPCKVEIGGLGPWESQSVSTQSTQDRQHHLTEKQPRKVNPSRKVVGTLHAQGSSVAPVEIESLGPWAAQLSGSSSSQDEQPHLKRAKHSDLEAWPTLGSTNNASSSMGPWEQKPSTTEAVTMGPWGSLEMDSDSSSSADLDIGYGQIGEPCLFRRR